MKHYTDNPLFNDMANMQDKINAEKAFCQYPTCKHKVDHSYDDFCNLHEHAISDAMDEWDREKVINPEADESEVDYE